MKSAAEYILGENALSDVLNVAKKKPKTLKSFTGNSFGHSGYIPLVHRSGLYLYESYIENESLIIHITSDPEHLRSDNSPFEVGLKILLERIANFHSANFLDEKYMHRLVRSSDNLSVFQNEVGEHIIIRNMSDPNIVSVSFNVPVNLLCSD